MVHLQTFCKREIYFINNSSNLVIASFCILGKT
jgi:hypothetical protein